MKSGKPLWRISVATTLEAEDAVGELLGSQSSCAPAACFDFETGTSLVSVFSGKKFPPAIRNKISAGLAQIKNCGLEIGAGKIKVTSVKREDWAESWKRHFNPIEIGGALLVKPSWSKRRAKKNQAVVILDPGLSFGTGQHPTTAFCLKQITAVVCSVGVVRRQSGHRFGAAKSFLDIGTGSGILAIAAAKLGCAPVDAFDFDPAAVKVARANARTNGVAKKIHLARRDVRKLPRRPARHFDLICANLISNLLFAERKKIVAQLNRDGILILAGILKSEFAEVENNFAALGLELVVGQTENEWRSGAFGFA
jgi:ribosomal protein L11 methyltransferase